MRVPVARADRGGTRMNERSRMARTLQRELSRVLLNEWNPIGVDGSPETDDEYDRYVGGVYRLLASGATDTDLAEHLASLEAQMLGYEDTDPKMLLPVARKLRRVCDLRTTP